MICYALTCEAGHRFDSWFKSAAAYDALAASGHLSCGVCGGSGVRKALMAPRVNDGGDGAAREGLAQPGSEAEEALAALRQHVESHADYVGPRFAEEVRSMYLGAAPERAIYGEASGREARALLEDGVPIAPLPFLPTRKSN